MEQRRGGTNNRGHRRLHRLVIKAQFMRTHIKAKVTKERAKAKVIKEKAKVKVTTLAQDAAGKVTREVTAL